MAKRCDFRFIALAFFLSTGEVSSVRFLTPIFSAIGNPVIKASYSASLLVASNLNRKAYVNSTPSGSVSITLAPHPSTQDVPSVNKLYFVGSSSSFFVESSESSSSGLSTMKSASTCPITDILGL
ncbi:hypothetical protein Tco_0578983 [Tanacetum coccineum]